MRDGGAGGSRTSYGRLRVILGSGVCDLSRHGGLLAPIVLDGLRIGSLLGDLADLADRAGGAGGATGGALTGGRTFEVEVGAGLIDAGRCSFVAYLFWCC
jgi:hypothetical protein